NGEEMAAAMRRGGDSKSAHHSVEQALAGALEVGDGAYVNLKTGELVLREDLSASSAFELLPHELVHVLQVALVRSLLQQLKEKGLSKDEGLKLYRAVLEGQAQAVASAVLGTCIGLAPDELQGELHSMSRRAADMWPHLKIGLRKIGAKEDAIA